MVFVFGRCSDNVNILYLSKDEALNPSDVIASFFCDHSLQDIRDHFCAVSETCLTTDTPPWNKAINREEVLLYHAKILRVIEAAWVLTQNTF